MDEAPPGKIAVVTGATGGIGREIARGMAGMGITVVIGARSLERGEAAAREIAASAAVPSDAVVAMEVDVTDPASVRTFAWAVAARFGTLDVLVNNAGAWFTDRRVTPTGVELTFATNVLGPHLVTGLLLPTLEAAGHARVVNMVSGFSGNYDVTDLQFSRRSWDGGKAYAQSKRALSLLTWGLAARTRETGVTANAAEPGFVRTGFNRNATGFRASMINFSARLFAVSAAKGAGTPLWVATAPELAGVTGQRFAVRKAKSDTFRDPAEIAKLEEACRALEGGG